MPNPTKVLPCEDTVAKILRQKFASLPTEEQLRVKELCIQHVPHNSIVSEIRASRRVATLELKIKVAKLSDIADDEIKEAVAKVRSGSLPTVVFAQLKALSNYREKARNSPKHPPSTPKRK